MSKVAVLVDLGFFLHRYRALKERDTPHPPAVVADNLFKLALDHAHRDEGDDLYRILCYDCEPLAKKVHHPLTKRAIDLSKSDTAVFRHAFHRALVSKRKLALRLGELRDNKRWILRPEATRELIDGARTFGDLAEEDFVYDIRQKGVDIKIGIDISAIAFKRLAQKIVLVSGDSDFVPAAKLARREGIDFVLDPMWQTIPPDLHEHIDGLHSPWPKPAALP